MLTQLILRPKEVLWEALWAAWLELSLVAALVRRKTRYPRVLAPGTLTMPRPQSVSLRQWHRNQMLATQQEHQLSLPLIPPSATLVVHRPGALETARNLRLLQRAGAVARKARKSMGHR